MSDQQAPPNGTDTPAVAGPNEAPGAAQPHQDHADPYEKRYNDLRPEFDRATAERNQLAERQQWYEIALTTEDEDTRRQALEALGYELPEDEYADEEFDPSAEYEDPYDDRIQRIEQRFEQQDQEQAQAMEADFVSGYAHDQLDQLGIGRDDNETRQLIFERALSLPPLPPSPGMPTGWLPDMKTAHEQFQAWENARMKQWASTKRAPYVSPGGRDATEAPVLGRDATHEQRVAFAAQKYQELADGE